MSTKPNGWAYACAPDSDRWIGGFATRDEAVAEGLSDYGDGSLYVSQTRDLGPDDEDAEDGWDFICVGPIEAIKP